ncbi:MAG: histidinol dehydrogenase [Saprospiraceae bacterium]|jgi:histidinol dehydrogenase
MSKEIYIALTSYSEPQDDIIQKIIKRPEINATDLSVIIDDIYKNVKEAGDEALIAFTKKFDNVALTNISVSEQELENASGFVSQQLKNAIDTAYANIKIFHEAQRLVKQVISTTDGVECWQESRAIDRVGLYIPGGSAPLFSTVLMLGVPAQVAGCDEVVLCTPPSKDGTVHPAILYAASLCGISKIIKVGGAQSIAGLVLGTETIPSVYKVFGPGNQYVTAAKMQGLQYGVAIDLPAGPSEVLVYADASSNPAFVASDLLSQAEHGRDSQVVIVASHESIVKAVETELQIQLELLPRKEIARLALQSAFACIIEDVDKAYQFINAYAPEHFIIASDSAEKHLSKIRNAGSVFIGHWTPESAGDYASGTNHTLPTGAFARAYSGVSLDSFVKKITFQKIDKVGLNNLGPTIVTMAENEELEGHANAVKLRMEAL